jgi:hypothetical protein
MNADAMLDLSGPRVIGVSTHNIDCVGPITLTSKPAIRAKKLTKKLNLFSPCNHYQ